MFNFIKKFFKEEKVEIQHDDIEEFAKKKIEESNSTLIIQKFQNSFSNTSKDIAKYLDVLVNAKLQNDKIPPRHKLILDGNKDAYIKRTNIFVNDLKSDGIDEKNVFDIIEKNREEINSYTKSTQKQYAILQEFFANESYNVAKQIKRLHVAIKDLENDISNSEYFNYKKIIDLFDQKKNRKEQIHALEKDLDENKKNSEELSIELKKLEKEIKTIEKSDDYAELKRLKDHKKELERKYHSISVSISDDFGTLGRALRKYSKLSFDEKIIESLIAKPLGSILKYNINELKPIFKGVLQNVSNDKIQLKGNMKNKSIKILEKMDTDWIQNIKNNIDSIKKEISDTNDSINKNDIKDKITFIRGKIERTHNEQDTLSKKREIKKKDLSKITFDDIEKKIDDILVKVNVSVVS